MHRLAIRLPFELPVNPFAPRDVRAILLAGRYDVAHVHAGVVSPFAYDAMKVVLDLGLPDGRDLALHARLDRAPRPVVAAAARLVGAAGGLHGGQRPGGARRCAGCWATTRW